MSDLEFIKNEELRETLENSIEYIYALFENSKNHKQRELYKEETYRVIILYVISVYRSCAFVFLQKTRRKNGIS